MKNTPTSLYAFTLGREWKLSLAELISVWWEDAYQMHSEEVALFQIVGYSDEQLAKRFLTLGGSIRVIAITGESSPETFPTDTIALISGQRHESKITFALGAYGLEYRLSDIGLRIKKTLTEKWLSVRLANTENKNINAASYKKDKLSRTKTEYNLIVLGDAAYIGYTIACQDIDAYANRDTAKVRDMVVGMMPPKLVQMMINISQSSEQKAESRKQENIKSSSLPTANCKLQTIYDPFCGLGTTLIEAANMWILEVSGSDLSTDMVRASKEWLEEFIKTELVWQERIRTAGGTPAKNFTQLVRQVFHLDAREVKTAFAKHNVKKNTTIISEGYLGEVMSPRDITLDRVQSERRKLANMYDAFFRGLDEAGYTGTIVMSFPFWNIHGTYSYLSEIYDIIRKNWFQTVSLLPGDMGLNTREWSLLYRRENQTVGREIVKIIRQKNV